MPDFTYSAVALQSGQRKYGTLTAANKEEAEKKVIALFPSGSGEVNVAFMADTPSPLAKPYVSGDPVGGSE